MHQYDAGQLREMLDSVFTDMRRIDEAPTFYQIVRAADDAAGCKVPDRDLHRIMQAEAEKRYKAINWAGDIFFCQNPALMHYFKGDIIRERKYSWKDAQEHRVREGADVWAQASNDDI